MRTVALIAALLVASPLLAGCDETPEQPEVQDQATDEETADETGEQADEEVADGQPEAGDEEPDLADDLEPGETGHYGEPFTIEDAPVELSEALAHVEDSEEGETSPTVKVESRIERVCQKKGCWFTLQAEDVDRPVRVRMKDYGFFVPRNTGDATAVVEGTVEPRTIDEDLARHYAEDVADQTGEEPEEIDGPVQTYRFIATGISIQQPES